MWSMAGSFAQMSLSDGVITRPDTIRLLLNPVIADELAQVLIGANLWHGPGHACDRCPAVGTDAYLFHDWFDLGYDTGAQTKTKRRKSKELKDRRLVDAVWARDCVDPADPGTAKCRYCGNVVKRHDRRDPVGSPTTEHVDPARGDGVRNIVVACRPCNQRKGQRTPAQAGMTLRPPPRRSVDDPTVAATDTAIVQARPAVEPKAPAGTAAADERPAAGGRAGQEGPSDRSNVDINGLSTDYQVDSRLKSAVLGRARGGRAGLEGLGQGSGVGSGLGDGSGSGRGPAPPSASRRSRGRRGRRVTAPPTQVSPDQVAKPQREQPAVVWDAGSAPVVESAGRFGSPWHGWRGPPPEGVEESTCPEHGLADPCRRCFRA